MIRLALRIVATAVLLGAVLPVAPGTQAADELIASSPADGATVATAPASVDLTFDAAFDSDDVQIVVIAPNGARADTGVSETTAEGVRSVTLRSGLSSGDYLVYWVSGEPGKRATSFGDLAFKIAGDFDLPATIQRHPAPTCRKMSRRTTQWCSGRVNSE